LLLMMLAKDRHLQRDKALLLILIWGFAIVAGCMLFGSLIYSG
jgi:hypothetical protein